jgi:hypothetical protein
MSFGSELWDQVKTVEEYVSFGVNEMLNINELLKGFAAAEFEYGKSLQKTVKLAQDERKKNADKWSKDKVSASAVYNDG